MMGDWSEREDEFGPVDADLRPVEVLAILGLIGVIFGFVVTII